MPAERLGLDHRADDVAVDVKVAAVEFVGHQSLGGLAARHDATGEGVSLLVHSLDHALELSL